MSKKALFLGFVKPRASTKKEYRLSLINFQNGKVLPLKSEREIIQAVSFLCSFSESNEYESAAINSVKQQEMSLLTADGEEFLEAEREGIDEALDFSEKVTAPLWEELPDSMLQGGQSIADWLESDSREEDAQQAEENAQYGDDGAIQQECLPLAEMSEQFATPSDLSESNVCLPVDEEAIKPLYEFDRHFTLLAAEVPRVIREQYDLLDIEVARDAVVLFPRIEKTIARALHVIGAEKTIPVAVVNGVPEDTGCRDDSLRDFQKHVRIIKRR